MWEKAWWHGSGMGQVWEEGLKAWVSVGQAWVGWVRHMTAHNVGPQPLAAYNCQTTTIDGPHTTNHGREKREAREEREK